MKAQIKIALVALLLLGTGAGLYVWKLPPKEPVYRGTGLSEWLARENQVEGRIGGYKEPDYAPLPEPSEELAMAGDLRKMSGEVVPYLSHYIEMNREEKQPGLVDRVREAVCEMLFLKPGASREEWTREDRLNRALVVLSWMGEDAAPALPVVVPLLGEGSHETATFAGFAIQSMGPASWPAVERGLAGPAGKQKSALLMTLPVRLNPLATPPSREDRAKVVGILLDYMDGPDPHMRLVAMKSLGVSRRLTGEDQGFFDPAIRRLMDIAGDKSLGPNPHLRATAAETLGEFGEGAKPAIPLLKEMTEDLDFLVRYCAKKALAELTGEKQE